MQGMVLRVNGSRGAAVKKGNALIVIEAMKMENSTYSLADDKIAEGFVDNGDVVRNGDVLMVMQVNDYKKHPDAGYGDATTCSMQIVLLWELYKKMNRLVDEKIKNPLPVFHPYFNMAQIARDINMNCKMALAAGQFRRNLA